MRINDILKFFVPKDDSFFPLFEGEARCIVEASNYLGLLADVKTDEERMDIYSSIKRIEKEGDDYTHTVYDQLNKSFLTPFDREDIHLLASHLDDVLDYIHAVSKRLQWYNVKEISDEFRSFVEVIKKSSIEIQVAVSNLNDPGRNRKKILDACVNLNTLENDADDIFYSKISIMFENKKNKNILKIIKSKDIFQTLEKCADAAEDVSDVIKTILIKNV